MKFNRSIIFRWNRVKMEDRPLMKPRFINKLIFLLNQLKLSIKIQQCTTSDMRTARHRIILHSNMLKIDKKCFQTSTNQYYYSRKVTNITLNIKK